MYDRELDDIANAHIHTTDDAALWWKGAMMKHMPNPRGCPGSHEKTHADEHGRAVCSFCNNDYRVRNDGKLSAHPRST